MRRLRSDLYPAPVEEASDCTVLLNALPDLNWPLVLFGKPSGQRTLTRGDEGIADVSKEGAHMSSDEREALTGVDRE